MPAVHLLCQEHGPRFEGLCALTGLSYAQRQIAEAQGMSEADMLRQLYDDDD